MAFILAPERDFLRRWFKCLLLLGSDRRVSRLEIFDILHVDPNFLYQDDFSSELAEAHVLTPQQSTLLAAFDQLNDEGQTKAVEYVEDLVLTGRYKKCPASGLGAKEA